MIKNVTTYVGRIDHVIDWRPLIIEHHVVRYNSIDVYNRQTFLRDGGNHLMDILDIDVKHTRVFTPPHLPRSSLEYAILTPKGLFKGQSLVQTITELTYDNDKLVEKKVTEYADYPENITNLTLAGDIELVKATAYTREIHPFELELQPHLKELLTNIRLYLYHRNGLAIPPYFTKEVDLRLVGEDVPIHDIGGMIADVNMNDVRGNLERVRAVLEKLEIVLNSLLEKMEGRHESNARG